MAWVPGDEPTDTSDTYLLQEEGFYLLQEDGCKLILDIQPFGRWVPGDEAETT